MTKPNTILAALIAGLMLTTSGMPAFAQDAAAPAATDAAAPAATTPAAPAADAAAPAAAPAAAAPAAAPVAIPVKAIEPQAWSFAGIFGRYDQNQLRRGFLIFKEVCSSCHSADLLAFRNLSEPGGPAYTADQVKALAATYTIDDPSAPGGKRPGVASDRFPPPFATEQDARDANGGAHPPDWSVLAKARSIKRPFPTWLFDYFTTYQEGGPDYIHALLTGYHDEPPAGFVLPDGKHYNDYFPGHAIGMAPPLSDGLVTYTPGPDGTTVPETVEQYSHDVSAFMMWMAEPGLDARKEAGFRVILFLLLFAGLMWAVKRKIWSNVEGH